MQRLEVSGAVRPIYGSLGVKGLSRKKMQYSYIKKIHGYYKRNRRLQRYVVSKPLAQWTYNLRSSVENRVFVPSLPVSLIELKQRITTAAASVDENMLMSAWTELE